MRKPFHTFLSAGSNINNNVFYSGALNPQIKNILLKNVKNLFESKKEDLNVTKKVYSISAECLDKLSDISKLERKNGNNPVLFNLLKDIDCYHLNLGVVVHKSDCTQLKKILEELKSQSPEETKKKIFSGLNLAENSEHLIEPVLSLMTIAVKSNRNFTHIFETYNADELFLTLKFNIENQHLNNDWRKRTLKWVFTRIRDKLRLP